AAGLAQIDAGTARRGRPRRVRAGPGAGQLVTWHGDEGAQAYPEAIIAAFAGRVTAQPGTPARAGTPAPRAVYTPLHGVAAGLALRAIERAGFPPPLVVAAQAEPDPGFPTLAFPNPEEPGTLDLALAQAARDGADLLLA